MLEHASCMNVDSFFFAFCLFKIAKEIYGVSLFYFFLFIPHANIQYTVQTKQINFNRNNMNQANMIDILMLLCVF